MRCLGVLGLLVAAGMAWGVPVYAAAGSAEGPAALPEASALAEAQARSLDTGRLDAMIEELNRDTAPYFAPLGRDALGRILRGEGNPWRLGDLIRGFGRYFFNEVIGSLGLLAKLVALAVLAAVLFNLQSSFSEAGVARVAHAVVLLALVGLALASFRVAVEAAATVIGRLGDFMQAILPLLITLLAGSGSVVTAGLFHPLVLSATYLSSLLVVKWVFPLLFLSAVVETVTGFSENLRLSGLARLLRQAGMVALGLGLCLFLGVIAVYGAAGAVADGVTLRSAKFMAKAFVPVVGGMFADAAELVASASLLLRNGLGLLGLAAIFFAVSLPVLKLISLILIYRLAGAAIQPVAASGVVACLDGLATSLTLVCVAVGAVAVMFLMAIGALVGAGNAAVMLR